MWTPRVGGLTREDAFWRVNRATERLTKLGAEVIYKKVDSTLRGNIGAELDAAMSASKADFAFFAPAYPTYGRTTLAGKQLVDNNPVDKTEYADELCVKSADISSIISAQSKRKVGLIGFDQVKGGVESIKTSVEALRKEGVEVADLTP